MISVSVIIPTFKRVDQTIVSLKLLKNSKGIGEDFEVEYIVSDSSPDSTLKSALQKTFSDQIVYTRPQKTGIAANKNQGARIAQHELLIFCDSDIEVEPETLRITLETLKKYSTAGMVGGTVLWKGGPKNEGKDRPRVEDRIETYKNTSYIESLYSRYVATYKDLFWNVGGYDEAVFNMRGEGSDLSIRYWRAGYPLVLNENIKVHHVYDVTDAAAVRVKNSQWGIAKDLVLLMYKYGMVEGSYPNFIKTVAATFSPLGESGYAHVLQGIVNHLDFITDSKVKIDKQISVSPEYDFKFLEVFSDSHLFHTCVDTAAKKLEKYRKKAFSI